MCDTLTYNAKIVEIYTWNKWAPDGLSFISMGTTKTYDLNMNLINEITKPIGMIGQYD